MIDLKTKQFCIQIVLKATDFFENNNTILIKTKDKKRDVVSNLDLLIENFIIKKLSKLKIPIISEEKKNNLKFKKNNSYFILDPLDGSANFINNIPYFSISLGYLTKNNFAFGVVCAPKLKELYFTINKTSYLNGRSLALQKKELEDSLIALSLSSQKNQKKENIFGKLNNKSSGCIRQGSASLNICSVASGKFQVACGFDAKIWDIAGALPIAKYAGYNIKVKQNKKDNSYNYIVAHPDIIHKVEKIINE